MREEKNIEIYRDIIVDFFNSRLNPIVIYVYGSILGCAFNDESDIDIAVIADKKIDSYKLYDFSAELSVILKRDVHLVDFRAASDVLKIEILKKREILFCRDEDIRLYNEMNALSSYTKLNEEREIVIRAKYGEGAWMLL